MVSFKQTLSSLLTDINVWIAVVLIATPAVFHLDDTDLIVAYFTKSPLPIAVAVFLFCELATLVFGNNAALSAKDIWISRWYLLNACFYHTLFDPVAGALNGWSLMSLEYRKMDARFGDLWAPESMPASLAVWLEAFVMAPLCFAVFFGYRITKARNRHKPKVFAWVYFLETIVSILHLAGDWMFYGSEYALIYHKLFHADPNPRNVPLISVDWNLQFSFDHVFYFWFAFVALPLYWVFVPLYMVQRSWNDVHALLVSDMSAAKGGSKKGQKQKGKKRKASKKTN